MKNRWLLEFEAIDPRNPPDDKWSVGVPEWLYRQQQIHGHEKQSARLWLVADVLQGETRRLYEGWSRPGKDDDCYVYAGRPGRDFKSRTIETSPPKRMVFLIFVLPDGSIDDWTWRPCTDSDADSPSGVNGRLIWSLNPS